MRDDYEDTNETRLVEPISEMMRMLIEGQESIVQVKEEVCPEGKPETTIRFGRRKLQPEPAEEPTFRRSLRRAHTFYDGVSVIEYLKNNTEESAKVVVIADPSTLKAAIVLDETLYHTGGREVCFFQPCLDPVFEKWAHLCRQSAGMEVKAFALFLLQNRRLIVDSEAITGHQMALLFSQVKSAETVESHTGVGAKSVNGVMVSVNIQGTLQETPMDLPEQITIKTPIFTTDQEAVECVFDLTIYRANNETKVAVSNPDLDRLTAEQFVQQVELINDETAQDDCDWTVVYGSHGETPWLVVEQG